MHGPRSFGYSRSRPDCVAFGLDHDGAITFSIGSALRHARCDAVGRSAGLGVAATHPLHRRIGVTFTCPLTFHIGGVRARTIARGALAVARTG